MITLIQKNLQTKGGLEKSAHLLLSKLIEQKIPVTVLTTGECSLPCPVISFPIKKKGLALYKAFDLACQQWLKNNPQEIVLSWDRSAAPTHYRAGNGVHKAFLERRRHSSSLLSHWFSIRRPLHHYYLEWEKKTFESPDLKRLFTNSYMVKEELLSHYPIQSEKIEVIHNGVEWQERQQDFDKSLFYEANRPFHFLFAGNGYERKGLNYLLQGLSLIKEPFKLSVVGYEKKESAYKKRADQLGLNKKVTFYGPQPTLLPFFQQADCLVIPSIYDPFANTTVEALAMGLFVVSSSYNGGKEVLTEKTGTIIDSLYCPESVAHTLRHAMRSPKTLKRAQLIRSQYSHLDFSCQIDKMLSSLLCTTSPI